MAAEPGSTGRRDRTTASVWEGARDWRSPRSQILEQVRQGKRVVDPDGAANGRVLDLPLPSNARRRAAGCESAELHPGLPVGRREAYWFDNEIATLRECAKHRHPRGCGRQGCPASASRGSIGRARRVFSSESGRCASGVESSSGFPGEQHALELTAQRGESSPRESRRPQALEGVPPWLGD